VKVRVAKFRVGMRGSAFLGNEVIMLQPV